MNRRLWALGLLLSLGLLGCQHAKPRSQAPDEPEKPKNKEAEVTTIGSITSVANADPIPVSGVGLVVGLEGTGGDAPPSGYRTLLEDHLRKKGYEKIRELLASPDVSMVLVSGLIPPGAKEGDPIDVAVTLPPGSRTTSLRGGYLKECDLYNFDFTKNLDPNYGGANLLKLGHVCAKVEGHLLVGVGGEGEDDNPVRQGRIWGGGKSRIARPFYLVINEGQQRAPVAQRIADRVNEVFHGPFRGSLNDLATAKTKTYVLLRVPEQYKHNLPRFLRVVRMIPLQGQPPAHSAYRSKLDEELLDPKHTITVALRLEALGKDGEPALRAGLQSKHPLVRFAAAEALAYLGCPACGEELAKLVQRQPLLRAYALTALASMDEAVSHVKLADLLSANGPETRYGAFRALRALDDRDPAVQGELLNNSFWVHHVAPDSSPLVHVSSSRRAEVVLFGEDPALVPPFSFLCGDFTVTSGNNDTRCTIRRLSLHHRTAPKQCSLKLEDILHCLADLGGTYPEAVDVLRQAGKYQCLSCPLAIDALPQSVSVYELAKEGAKTELLQTDEEILNAQEELGATPTLYDRNEGRRSSPPREKVSADDVSTSEGKKPPAEVAKK